MSSETKSRAGLIAKWRAKANLAKANGRWAEAIEGEICADELEALESSSSADPGGREALSGMLAERMIKLAIKIQGPYAPFGPPESLARRKKSHEERIEELTGMLTAEFAECLEAVPARSAGTTGAEGLEHEVEAIVASVYGANPAYLAESAATQRAPVTPPASERTLFQARVHAWMLVCFGDAISADKMERNHRFLEESLELVQSLGCTRDEAHQLVDYVFARTQGEPSQECGGVLVTLAALCNAQDMNLTENGEKELSRVWTKVDQIRAKQAAKPKHSPLATPAPVTTPGRDEVLAKEAWDAGVREGCEFPWAVAEMGPITVDVLKGLAEESKRLHPYMSLIYHGWIAQRLNHLVFHAVRAALRESGAEIAGAHVEAVKRAEQLEDALATPAPVTTPGRDEVKALIKKWRGPYWSGLQSDEVNRERQLVKQRCADELEAALAAAKEPDDSSPTKA